MTKAERDLLMFLAMHMRGELDDWTYQPTRNERRQILDRVLDRLRDEDAEAKKAGHHVS